MTSLLSSLILLAIGHPGSSDAQAIEPQSAPRSRNLLDLGWRFHLGNAADRSKDFYFGGADEFAKSGNASGPARPSFNDGDWRTVNLPHDFVVESPIQKDKDGAVVSHGFRPTGRDYPDKTIGWYRKRFDIPASDLGKRLSLQFDGVFRDCTVWVNGNVVARNTSGYMGFDVDISDVAEYGSTNTVVVRADATEGEGWFYEGGGIYRHVWLVTTGPLYIPHYGLAVTPTVDGANGAVVCQTEVRNESDVPRTATVTTQLIDPDGKSVAQMVQKGIAVGPRSTQVVRANFAIPAPRLWSIETPTLYTAAAQISEGDKVVDNASTTCGFRSIRFDPDKGFFLNGKHVWIQGTCNHQDHAGVGAGVPDAVNAYRIKLLKEMGCNAYRTSHNPPTPELLDACDRQGMMVMDENRLLDSSDEGLSQIERLVKRDRNHPSVILWSICNEEFAVQDTDRGRRMAESLIRKIHTLDKSRPVTCAANNGGQFGGVNAVMEVRGVNYAHGTVLDDYHTAHPTQPIMGSEDGSTVSTRGEYVNDPAKGYVRAYDTEIPPWANTAEAWMQLSRAKPFYAGGFIWTGFDYRGEPTPYGWPCVNSHFGLLDTCGFAKDNFYYYKAWWGTEDLVHLLPHWNWDTPGQMVDVWCYSNSDEVELLVNGQSQGRKPMPKFGHVSWQVPYAAGALEARGYRAGKLVKTDRVETAGAPAKIVLTPDRSSINADGEDVSVVNVSVVDAQGRVVPSADQDIQFSTDNGTILGVGNGDPSSHEDDRFFALPASLTPTGWVSMPTALETTTIDKLDWTKATPVTLSGEANQIRTENTTYAYQATFDATDDLVKKNPPLLVSQIDDFGWVFVNGKKVGETKRWDRAYTFDMKGVLKSGKNTIEIIARNNGGEGGVGSVSLSWMGDMPTVHRKAFHGLCQTIFGATQTPGKLTLTASAPGLTSATIELQAGAK